MFDNKALAAQGTVSILVGIACLAGGEQLGKWLFPKDPTKAHITAFIVGLGGAEVANGVMQLFLKRVQRRKDLLKLQRLGELGHKLVLRHFNISLAQINLLMPIGQWPLVLVIMIR